MSTIYEGGHARNVAALQKLIQLYTQFGASYSPTTSNITLTALNTLHTNANGTITSVKNTYNDWKNATNTREIAFSPLKNLATQLYNVLQSSGANKQTLADFLALVHKMRGERTSKNDPVGEAEKVVGNPSSPAAAPNDPPAEVTLPVTKSNAQLSFDNMVEHFDKMIKLLATVPSYAPNENAFKVTTLNTQLASLRTVNNSANDAYIKWVIARISRNKIFYGETTGMLDIARKSKSYVKAKFGSSSQEYKAASAIKFVRVISVRKAR